MEKANSKLTEDEEQHLKGENLKYGDVTAILGRRKNGRTIEYECTFHGQNPRDKNKYIASEKLIEMGYEKLVNQCDLKTAAMAAGLDVRPLLNAEIQKHLDDFNLEAEYGTHGTIKRLSGVGVTRLTNLMNTIVIWNVFGSLGTKSEVSASGCYVEQASSIGA